MVSLEPLVVQDVATKFLASVQRGSLRISVVLFTSVVVVHIEGPVVLQVAFGALSRTSVVPPFLVCTCRYATVLCGCTVGMTLVDFPQPRYYVLAQSARRFRGCAVHSSRFARVR